MVDYLSLLRNDLEKGYSKADLEWAIGLPQNCLSGIMKGDKKLSKKSELKIDVWEKSEKPSPLKIMEAKEQMKLAKIKAERIGAASGVRIELKDLTEPTGVIKPQEPIGSRKTNFTINTLPKTDVPPMPLKMDGEDSMDYAARKSEWKKNYNQ